MIEAPNNNPAPQTWTRRERWLAAGLVFVSIAFGVERVKNTDASSAAAVIPTSSITATEGGDLNEFPLSSVDILSDDADPQQAKQIHVPGQEGSNTQSVGSHTNVARSRDRRTSARQSEDQRRADSKEKAKSTDTVMTDQQIDAALAELEAMEWGPEAEKKLSAFVQLWASQDPIAALDYALGIESNKTRTGLVKSVFGKWMKEDSGSARAWFYTMLSEDPQGVESIAGLVYKDLGLINPSGVLAEISKLPANSLKRSALSTVVSQFLAQDNINALFALHDSMEPGTDQDLLTEAILRGAGIYMPNELGDWALGLEDAHSRKVALDGIVRTWSADQPVSASEWVEGLVDAEERERTLAIVAQNWAKQDAVATGDWLISLKPPSPTLDPAVMNFVKAVKKENPSGAMAWVGAISDEKERTTLMTQVGKEWIKADREAALAYVGQTPLPESVVKAILAADPGP